MTDQPKKRGRPTNAERAARVDAARQTNPAVAGSYERAVSAVLMAKAPDAAAQAQLHALRMWAKQSPDLSRHERTGRIRAALEAQGLSMEGVELP